MATKKTPPAEEPEQSDAPPEPDEKRARFLAGEITWREYTQGDTE